MSQRDHYVWPVGLVLAFVVMVAVNAVFIYLANRNAPHIEASYDLVEER